MPRRTDPLTIEELRARRDEELLGRYRQWSTDDLRALQNELVTDRREMHADSKVVAFIGRRLILVRRALAERA